MKFTKTSTEKGLRVPKSALHLCGFQPGEPLELRTQEGALAVLKGAMTAMELIRTAQGLQALAAELLARLSKTCAPCEGCHREGCPIPCLEDGPITLPDYVRREAGIPETAKLGAIVDPTDHSVTLCLSEHKHDLWDVPEELLEAFQKAGVCLGALEEMLMTGEIVYGG